MYGKLTGRVISIIRKETPAYFRYSIDECFMYLDGIEHTQLQQWGEHLHTRVNREVGMPISIGLEVYLHQSLVQRHDIRLRFPEDTGIELCRPLR